MTADVVDLRSDTVTRPSVAMREAMMRADVGDDVYGEDPTVRRLEDRVAELAGKEAGLFVPSGTMSNQIALLLLTRRGECVIAGEGTHCAVLESGAAAAWSGVQFGIAGRGGLFGADDLEAALGPRHIVFARPSAVVVENTHNRAGGRIFAHGEVLRIARVARRHGLKLHLDGARLWNAAAATGMSEAELTAPFDTVSLCFSKGLGAPVGSALVGSRELVDEGRRYRKMLGGGMRQSGILAAAALYGLEHHRSRLVDDHTAAKAIAEIIRPVPQTTVDLASVETNIVNVGLALEKAEPVVAEARRRGVLVNMTGAASLRLVTHLDVSLARARAGAERLAQAITTVLSGAETRR